MRAKAKLRRARKNPKEFVTEPAYLKTIKNKAQIQSQVNLSKNRGGYYTVEIEVEEVKNLFTFKFLLE